MPGVSIPVFGISQGYTGFWLCLIIRLNNSCICLIVSRYFWTCVDMPEYAGICVTMLKSAWIAFVLRVPTIMPCQLERLDFKKVYSLKETKLIFSIVAENIWLVFSSSINEVIRPVLNFFFFFTIRFSKH